MTAPRHTVVARATRSLYGLCLLLSAGCHAAPAARFASADSALGQLTEQTNCSRAVMGEANLVLSRGPFSLSGDMMYMAAAPDRLRFDLYSGFGVTLSTLTSDGERFALYNLEDKSFWYGPAKTCNLERFTRVPIPPFALIELLRGRAPLLRHSSGDIKMRLMRPWFSRPYYRVDIVGDHQSTERLKLGVVDEDIHKPLSEQRLKLLSVEIRQAGGLVYRVKLDDHRRARRAELVASQEEIEMGLGPGVPSGPQCEALVPGSLSFVVPDTGYTLTIVNEELTHNPPLVPGAFTQPPPEGVTSQFSDCTD